MTQTSGASRFLTAARLFDGTGAPSLEDAAILLEGSTIRAIGRRADVRPPDGASAATHDYGDATILPGLVDGHTHLAGIGDGTRGDDVAAQGEELLLVRAAVNAQAMLRSGVTTIRENGSMGRVAFVIRDAIRLGITEGPRMVVAGRAVTITGGHLHYFGGAADGVEGVRSAVRRLVAEGADFIKVMSSGGSTRTSHPFLPAFTPPELRGAHRRGASPRAADRGTCRPEQRDRGGPRRGDRHGHPLLHGRGRRDVPLAARPRRSDGRDRASG